jgi:RpiR family carbohydrate utilization transcriptional regulator
VNELQPGEVMATIRSLLPSLLPTERAVAQVLLERSRDIVELSSQQVAELAGASRATVVRTAQSLGFSGYQQLRVLLARDAGYSTPPPRSSAVGPAAIVTDVFVHVGQSVDAMIALLDADAVARAVESIATAGRVLVVGNGLSAPLALDAAARLTSIGRFAEAPLDVIGQQISARLLKPGDVLLVMSGSGANAATMRAAEAAVEATATVVVITAFARSPLAALADIDLVVGMPSRTFQDEVTLTTRIPQVILLEGLVAAITERLGASAAHAKDLALGVIGTNLAE